MKKKRRAVPQKARGESATRKGAAGSVSPGLAPRRVAVQQVKKVVAVHRTEAGPGMPRSVEQQVGAVGQKLYCCETADMGTMVHLAALAGTTVLELMYLRRCFQQSPTPQPACYRVPEDRRRCAYCPAWQKEGTTPFDNKKKLTKAAAK